MTPVEVAVLMRDILEVDSVDVDESFFEVGGNSFLALNLISGIQERTGVPVGLLDVVRAPTATRISALVAAAAQGGGDGA
ncbi:MAG: hypothetical protein AUG49_17210 [Catenulispora sp. 13_1_20CM_3_70_7]|nr:MAG: hypothetical protein AUG49_17210 [Catenulispora sp. 13_1_20CM_3_70_7]